jgi:hypothetical protein
MAKGFLMAVILCISFERSTNGQVTVLLVGSGQRLGMGGWAILQENFNERRPMGK